MELKDIVLERYDASDRYLETKRPLWDNCEDLFHGVIKDAISLQTGNTAFDPKLANAVLEKESRVMAQLATGKVKAISRNDEGAAQLMNLTLDKYVVPNANSQFDFLTKLRMVDRYSNIYGSFFVMVDWDIRKGGYRGPDMWLIPMRDVFPQVGAISLDDSDHIIVRSWRPLSFFENLRDRDGYKNISKIVATLSDKSGSKQDRASDQKSQREQQQYPDASPSKKRGYHEVLSMYEKDRWVDMVVDADEVFRDIKNPHDNDELPVENKFSIPLMDDFMAFGDIERGAPMQNIVNSVWNLYLSAVKISIFPPTLINKDNVADTDSLKWSAAAKWLVRNNIGNAVQTMNLTPQGTATFNNVYQVATASILNQFGTTQTTTTAETDPGFGRTPQALDMQAKRENAKDSVDRFYMEQFISKVYKKFVNLISKKRGNSIQFRMFQDEIAELAQSYPEIDEMYDEKSGKLTISKSKMGNILYDYEIVSGSTYASDLKQQQQNLTSLLTMLLNPQVNQQVVAALQQENKELRLGELITRTVVNSGIQDWDKIIVDKSKRSPDLILNDDNDQFQQAVAQMMGGGNPEPTPQGLPAMMGGNGQPMQQQGQPMQSSALPQQGGVPFKPGA